MTPVAACDAGHPAAQIVRPAAPIEASTSVAYTVHQESADSFFGSLTQTHQRSRPLILGLGTDLIEIERIERSYQRFGEAFLARVYTPGEIAYCMAKRNYAESLAARFAAKEAGAKALGTGISRGVNWREFEVRRRPGQRPELHLSGRAAEIAARLGIRRLSLSLSHSRTTSIAIVTAED
jgi:holo-[acyl-carrier protein] synthase